MKWYRPNITVLLTVTIIVGFLMGKIDSQAFLTFATGLVVWWMKSRDEEKNKRQGGRVSDNKETKQ